MSDTGRARVVAARVRVPRADGLQRDRLSSALSRLDSYRLGLIVAPAGCGKTTLLAQFAAACRFPTSWYRSEESDTSAASLVAHLEQALAPQLGLDSGWETVEDVALALDSWGGAHAVLVLDDLHLLYATQAEAALARLIDYAPSKLTIVASSRRPPELNLSRLRMSGVLLEIGPDDLRFRSWEVERLFRDFYGEPLPPADLAHLARRTEGWAGALQLFHLATSGKPQPERRQAVKAIGPRTRLVNEYLTRNVLDELPTELRDFLVGTCVLGRLSGPVCDELLGQTHSAQLLAELERRRMFTYALDDDVHYRYHEVLRAHLEAVLVDDAGESGARARYIRAGSLLEEDGAYSDALRAFSRAEDWTSVARLLGQGSADIDLDGLPSAMRDHDPWLLLALARRHRVQGRWHEAVGAYRRAETAFGTLAHSETARRERRAISLWLEPTPAPLDDWTASLREAVGGRPLLCKERVPSGDYGLLVSGVCDLLAGRLYNARRTLLDAADELTASPALRLGARLGGAVASLLAGDPEGTFAAEQVAEDAERLGAEWLVRISRASLEIAEPQRNAATLGNDATTAPDQWGHLLIALFSGLGHLRTGDSSCADLLDDAAGGFASLGAGTLEAWSRCALALALARAASPHAREAAAQAEAMARQHGLRAPQAYAYLALAICDPGRASHWQTQARDVANECGLALPDAPATGPSHKPETRRVVLRCFGRFEIVVDGIEVDLTALRPRVRTLLHLLAMHAGALVHRDVIVEAMWPGSEPSTGYRNLQVAVSSLRTAVEVAREGDAYRLVLPDDADVDLRRFDIALASIRNALRRSEPAATAFDQLADMYRGELLAEDGPAEWVVLERDRRKLQAREAASSVAQALLRAGELSRAASACEQGLRIDRYADVLWKMLRDAYARAGDQAAATRAARDYEAVLAEIS